MSRLFLLGSPGSGKGTISKILLKSLGQETRYYNVGGILREQADQDRHIKDTHSAGGLVDSDRVLGIFEDALAQESFLVDGSPRKYNEAQFVLEHNRWKENPGWLINLDIEEYVARDRLLRRGRFDDTVEIIDRRLNNHKNETMKSIQLFRQAGRVIDVRAEATPEIVARTILQALQHI